MGTAAQDDVLCRRYQSRLGAMVAAVDYRLGARTPVPGTAGGLLHRAEVAGRPARRRRGAHRDRGRQRRRRPGRRAWRFLARDRVRWTVVAQFWPTRCSTIAAAPAHVDNPGFRIVGPRQQRLRLGRLSGRRRPEIAVPGRRHDLAGLPPAWIGVGTLDLFHDEDLAYAERLRAAGVPCETLSIPGAFHGFDGVAPKTHVAREFFDSQCDVLRPSWRTDHGHRAPGTARGRCGPAGEAVARGPGPRADGDRHRLRRDHLAGIGRDGPARPGRPRASRRVRRRPRRDGHRDGGDGPRAAVRPVPLDRGAGSRLCLRRCATRPSRPMCCRGSRRGRRS